MTPFVSGALGALVVLFVVATLRNIVRTHRTRGLLGRGLPLRFLFRRLGTRPEQEQVISVEAEALSTELQALRTDMRTVRKELADLLDAPAMGAAAVQAAIDARIARLSVLRARLGEGLARIHASLDPAQRSTLAALVREGPHRHRCVHAHAHAHH